MLVVDPPPARPGLMARPSLQAKLSSHLASCRVLVLHAPAGFGKSCALLQLFQSLPAGVAQWLLPEPADRLPRHAIRSMLALLGERPGAGRQPVLVFIDALERVPAACEGRWLRAVLDALPANVTLVMATRSFAPHALEHLRISGELVEFGASTLSMSTDEVATMCRRTPVRHHGEAGCWERASAGWPAIASLLQVSAANDNAAPEAVVRSAAFCHRVRRYLDDEVLATGSHDERAFLASIVPLGEVSAPLCDCLFERSDSAQRLARLVHHGMPVEALGDELYRVHPVLVAHAATLAGALSAQAQAALRRRAAEWFIRQGLIEQAVGHWIGAGAWDDAMRHLPALAQSLLFRARFQQVVDWCQVLPPAYLYSNPGLSVSYVWGQFFCGDLQRALQVLREVKTNMRGMCDPLVEQTINLQELILTDYPQYDYAALLQGVEALMPMLENVGDMNRGRISNMLAMIQISQGELAKAGTAVMQAKRIHREAGNLQGLFTSYFLEAATLATGGELKHALDVLENADEMIQSRSVRTLTGSMHVFCVGYRLQLLYELGQYDLARDWLDRYQRLHKGSPSVLSTLLAGIIDARLTLIDRGSEPALLVLERLADRFTQDAAVQRRLGFEMARIAIVSQNQVRLRALVGDLLGHAELPAVQVFVHPSEELEGAGIEMLRLMLHAGESSRAVAMQRLAVLVTEATQIGRSWRRMKLYLLTAVGHLCAGEQWLASKALHQALRLATVNGTISSFLDEGPALVGLLASLRTGGGLTGAEQRHADLILQIRDQATKPAASVSLGVRELEILRLVADGLTNEQVASRLSLATQTVKWYLSGMYGKLGVGNRIGAVDKCRRLGVL
ncbi:LuxR family transcriptional regulator [Jeongeupia sp. HS-3]|uniref:LuxR C-terminal-related transcriptional regulator n=1 Tax=Jeongeupia sp. HS-3 TaxID=1009682 RepID=UPI0018A452B2|nr:LuxR C-terminal-related transcriptional regulator [Jeongeupia sp. HS-3]BCL74868.1 LuxR family transcriptional regulator [Jeongeupia sp. HS-3]